MKVLYFYQYFKTRKGTGSTRPYEMARHLIKEGHEVTMVYALNDKMESSLTGEYKNGMRRGEIDGINLIEFNIYYSNKLSFIQRTIKFLLYAFRSSKLVFKENYDLLFASSTPLTAGIPGIVMKLFRRKPFVFEVRDLWPELPREMGVIKNPVVLKLMDWLETISYKSADHCVALSPGIANGIKKKGKKDDEITIIPNGSDVKLFHPDKGERLELPQTDENDFKAVFTGAHGSANGLDNAIEAARILREKNRHDIKLVFIGDGKLKQELIAKSKKYDLANCIFMDPVPKIELVKYLRSADTGLMLLANIPAFYYGTSPNKFFDYIAMGLPVFNNYPGWLADMIEEWDCGMVVPPDDADAFAQGLIEMADNRKKYKKAGKRARELAIEKFEREKLAMEFINTLEKVCYA